MNEYKEVFYCVDSTTNFTAYIIMSLLISHSLKNFLYFFTPTFFITKTYVTVFVVLNREMKEIKSGIIIIALVHILITIMLFVIVIYRWFLIRLENEMHSFDDNSCIDQLKLILNKQTDGIALIEQTSVVLLSKPEEAPSVEMS